MTAPQNSGTVGQGEGFFVGLKNLLATLVDIARTRLELLGNEVEEETIRILGAIAKGVGALFLLGLGIVLLVATAAAAWWEHRVAIFGISTLVAVGVGILLLVQVKKAFSQPSALFRGSVAELKTDLERLRGKH